MPTKYDRPRKRRCQFYYRVAERMAMRKFSCSLGLLDMLKQIEAISKNVCVQKSKGQFNSSTDGNSYISQCCKKNYG